MISVQQAKRLTEINFPHGPERLAQELGVEIHESPLEGCDGWVLSGPAGSLIRLNSSVSKKRRRFTLAHELAHLLLGVPTIVGEMISDSLRSNNKEERRVNELAAELLLPKPIVQRYVPGVPVVADQIRKLASKANVSDLAAAIRVVNLAPSIGLRNAVAALFRNGKQEWLWSKTLKMSPSDAKDLLRLANESYPEPVRMKNGEADEIIVASLLMLPESFTLLFSQLLPSNAGNALSREEVRRSLEQYLFSDDQEFRMQVQGVFGHFRPRCSERPLETCLAEFFKEKAPRWDGERGRRINSTRGLEYVRLRLEEWCS